MIMFLENDILKLAEDWFYIDVNFEKYFEVSSFKFSLFIEVNNVLDTQNSTIINPVTGKAYEYGDDVPSSWNDPRYPDLQAPINSLSIQSCKVLNNKKYEVWNNI